MQIRKLNDLFSFLVCREAAEALRKITENSRCKAYLKAQKSECSC